MASDSKHSRASYVLEIQGDVAVLTIAGDWLVSELHGYATTLRAALETFTKVRIASSHLASLDTAGAFLIKSLVRDRVDGDLFSGQATFRSLYDLVNAYSGTKLSFEPKRQAFRDFWQHPLTSTVLNVGRSTEAFFAHTKLQAIFIGHVVVLGLLSLAHPKRIRWPALVNIMQRAGLGALPIVSLTSFFVGAVLAFLMVLSLKQYGGAVFAIDFVSIGVMREFAPIIAAVLMAGRSASSFTAEIGSMKMNQEIDAMITGGIDPYEALVLPRVMGLVIMAPLVTFVATIAGLFGGALVIWQSLDLAPDFFVERMWENVDFVNWFVGIVRAPVFAAAIALISCRLGMSVKGDVISLGNNVTTSVVQSIFCIFMADAVFALLFNGFNF